MSIACASLRTVTTAGHLPSFHPILTILLWHTNRLHLLHYIHGSFLWSSSFPPVCSSIFNFVQHMHCPSSVQVHGGLLKIG